MYDAKKYEFIPRTLKKICLVNIVYNTVNIIYIFVIFKNCLQPRGAGPNPSIIPTDLILNSNR